MKRSQMISGSCRDWYWTLEIIIIAKSGRVWHKELSRFVLCILVPLIGYHAVCNSANVGRVWMTAAQLVATLGTNEKPYKIPEAESRPPFWLRTFVILPVCSSALLRLSPPPLLPWRIPSSLGKPPTPTPRLEMSWTNFPFLTAKYFSI